MSDESSVGGVPAERSDTGDAVFAGSVPASYERHLVPLIFEDYATDLTARLVGFHPTDVLEVGAGTGVVTRSMAAALPSEVAITATDLNQAMLDHAATLGTARPVDLRLADAMALPFPDGSFDAVVCQFCAMFFPDKATAFAQVHRVLRPGGVFLGNVWDRIDTNDFARVVIDALALVFPDDPPRFIVRTPHGYHDPDQVRADLRGGGFDRIEIEQVDQRSRAPSCDDVAIAFCQGTPVRDEIEARAPGRLDEVTASVAKALGAEFGPTDLDGRISALVITARRD